MEYAESERHLSIPALLAARQECGLTMNIATQQYQRGGYPGSHYRGGIRMHRQWHPNQLLSKIAWNPSRMQNMTLAVGPGTPATICMIPSHSLSGDAAAASSSESSELMEVTSVSAGGGGGGASSQDGSWSSAQEVENLYQVGGDPEEMDSHHPDEEDDDDDSEEDHENDLVEQRRRRCRRRLDSDSAEERRSDAETMTTPQFTTSPMSTTSSTEEDDLEEEEKEDTTTIPSRRPQNSTPSIRHAGCINTATWLTTPWRLSTVNLDASASMDSNNQEDCPTQLVTSSDDRIVRFWDAKYAMGMSNPLPGGRNTQCPFAYQPRRRRHGDHYFSNHNVHALGRSWRDYYHQRPYSIISGSVQVLASLPTGHVGNVFHVTPLRSKPGHVVTCGADGYLRWNHLEDPTVSTIIKSPEFDDNVDSSFFRLRPAMCYSHSFLNANTGLLCSERGLSRFDLRLPPRQQDKSSLLKNEGSCKACAIWSSSYSHESNNATTTEVESTYVFCGGTGPHVALCDLRMACSITDTHRQENERQVVQRYCPSSLNSDTKSFQNVSISGLDLTKDRRELLVSYESDQIYTFPIFPNASSAAGPTMEEIHTTQPGDTDIDEEQPVQNELAAYGGHLNRYTFLKNAKYAGPNDEYICTGSDSGHAWIYQKSNGAVVSFLNADNSTCNGVIPHPTLPIFITYGIDSTAKLWRATVPVDPDTDDSQEGRAKNFYEETDYEMSALTREWDYVQHDVCSFNELSLDTYILPDQVLSRKELFHCESFTRSLVRRYMSGVESGPRIFNDLHRLPQILRRNQYECIRATGFEQSYPVEGDLGALMRRVSLIRLKHQADSQGLVWNPSIPWQLEKRKTVSGRKEETRLHPADLVPDNPSDWIPYDPELVENSWPCGSIFNLEDYGDFYRERYLHSEAQRAVESKSDGDANDSATPPPPPSELNTEQREHQVHSIGSPKVEDDKEGILDENTRSEDNMTNHAVVALPVKREDEMDTGTRDDAMNHLKVEDEEESTVENNESTNNSIKIKQEETMDELGTDRINAQIKQCPQDDAGNLKSEQHDMACSQTSKQEDAHDSVANEEPLKDELVLNEKNVKKEEMDDKDMDLDDMDSSHDSEKKEDPRLENARKMLYDTVLLLKEGGNEALAEGALITAARRYDKALRYCSVAYMKQCDSSQIPGNGTLLKALEEEKEEAVCPQVAACCEDTASKHKDDQDNGNSESDSGDDSASSRRTEVAWTPLLSWTPMLKLLITTRLNMAMLLLRYQFSQPDRSVELARLALRELKPFCVKKGKVMLGQYEYIGNEPEETYNEARMLQAKAFFRLGSAQSELGEYSQAVKSFEQSLKCGESVGGKPDSLVIRRLAEAKRERKRKNKRARRKFQMVFESSRDTDDEKCERKEKEKHKQSTEEVTLPMQQHRNNESVERATMEIGQQDDASDE